MWGSLLVWLRCIVCFGVIEDGVVEGSQANEWHSHCEDHQEVDVVSGGRMESKSSKPIPRGQDSSSMRERLSTI